MEVHHPHHLSHKKKWKEYFLEFLMLFLAVFLGFIAENIRETYIERHREKEYIASFIQNLRSDTADISKIIERNLVKTDAWYSLLQLANQDLSTHAYDIEFYERFFQGAFNPIFRPNDATLVQLKSSGNLRLVNKKEVTDSILSYDKKSELILWHNEMMQNSTDEIWKTGYSILQAWVFADSTYFLDLSKRKLLKKDLPPLSIQPAQLQLFFGHLGRSLLVLRVNREYLIQQKEKATRLIIYLEKKYNL
jgi:hypothetical protein